MQNACELSAYWMRWRGKKVDIHWRWEECREGVAAGFKTGAKVDFGVTKNRGLEAM